MFTASYPSATKLVLYRNVALILASYSVYFTGKLDARLPSGELSPFVQRFPCKSRVEVMMNRTAPIVVAVSEMTEY